MVEDRKSQGACKPRRNQLIRCDVWVSRSEARTLYDVLVTILGEDIVSTGSSNPDGAVIVPDVERRGNRVAR